MLELLEISHSSFSQTYRLVRNHVNGVTVTHEDASVHAYQYLPMRLSLTGPRDDLEQILKVEFGDLGETIPQELDAVRADDNFEELPKVVYRVYASDVLTSVLMGPLILEVKRFAMTREGSVFEAKAPSLNVNKTGETYNLPRFPMLRGLL